jgi:diguanylate cyclase (GGDEF)-like protein
MRQLPAPGRSRSVAFLTGATVMVALTVHLCWGVSAFAGWRISRFLTSMNPTLALCFEAAALVLWLVRAGPSAGAAALVARGLSWLIFCVGAAKLADFALGTGLCPDGLLIAPALRSSSVYPSSLSPAIALCLCVLATALLALDRPRWPRLLHPQLLMTAVLCVSLAVLTGYAYNTGGFYKYLPMSALTAADFILLGGAVILCRSEEGFMAHIPRGSPGAKSFTLLLPACVLIPFLLGGLAVLGGEQGWYAKAGTGSAIAAVLTILAMSVIVFFNSAALNRSDAVRRATLDELDRRNRELELEIAERKLAEQRAAYLATHDSLTGLPNRLLFLDRLENTVGRALRRRGNFALFYIDLDCFKPVNDLHGHHAGDELLRALGSRLAQVVREVDMVARLGGDEFGAIMEGPLDEASAIQMAQRLAASVGMPYSLALAGRSEPIEMAVGLSIGIALFPDHASDVDGLVRAADGAMYKAKTAGKESGKSPNIEMAH